VEGGEKEISKGCQKRKKVQKREKKAADLASSMGTPEGLKKRKG